MIRYLRTFAMAAETESFSQAGDRLGLTQSAVSTQIKRLEADLGGELFERIGKSVRLSAHGRALLADAERILDLYQGMQGRAARRIGQPLSLGAISTAQLGLLPGALRRFRAHHPDVPVTIHPGMSVDLLGLLETGELDMAVIVRPSVGVPRHLAWTPLLRETYVAVAPADCTLPLDTLLRDLPFIRYNRRSHGGQPVARFLRRQRIEVHDIAELDEPAAILQMVREGLGCAIIPATLLNLQDDGRIRALALPGPPLYREIGVLATHGALRGAASGTLVACLREGADALARPLPAAP